MEPQIATIGPLQLAVGLVFILIAGAASIYHSLKLERDLLIGTVRTFVQLFILGYVLKFVFDINNALLVLAVFCFMTFFAAWTVHGRVKEKQVTFFFPVLISMMISFFLVAYMVTAVIVNVDPWWEPRYFIPMGGMIIGNSMNAIAVALERLLDQMRTKRQEIEMMLCLGADTGEASRNVVKAAMQAGMIPSINSMMAVGMVFIPGMMTGQILAGADPVTAIRYQIVVMVMITGATALGTLISVLLVRKRCFGRGGQLTVGNR